MLPVRHLDPKSSGHSIIVGANKPEAWSGRHLPTTQRKEQPHIMERASITCSMTVGLMDAMGCELGCGTYVD